MRLFWHPYAAASAVQNMAFDWAMLVGPANAAKKYPGVERLPLERSLATAARFRSYAWTEDAISIGYTQKVAALTGSIRPGAQLVQRPTAGGLVDHENDWTYALSLPRNAPFARERSSTIYARLHKALNQAFANLGVEALLHPCPCAEQANRTEQSPGMAASCFHNPVPFDLMLEGHKKLAGAALRRTREGLLVQGSVARADLPTDFNFSLLEAYFIEALSQMLDTPIEKPSHPQAN